MDMVNDCLSEPNSSSFQFKVEEHLQKLFGVQRANFFFSDN
jgi:hypothetical protein